VPGVVSLRPDRAGNPFLRAGLSSGNICQRAGTLEKNRQELSSSQLIRCPIFGTLKARMGATHFLMKTLPSVATEMALHILAYNLTRDAISTTVTRESVETVMLIRANPRQSCIS
jgi:hypothetical protein